MAVAVAERDTKHAIEKKLWDSVIAKLEAARLDTSFIALTDLGSRARLEDLLKQLKTAKDRALYEDFRAVQTRDNADRYLRDAPLKSMKDTVQAFIDWENSRTVEQKLTLSTQISWSKWVDNKPARVQVWIKRDGAPADQKQQVIDREVQSAENGTSDDLGSDTFRWKPGEKLEVYVDIDRSDNGPFIFSDKLMGTFSLGRVAEEMAGGIPEDEQKLSMRPGGGSDRGTRVQIRVHGVPVRPPVGEWKENP